MDPNTHSMSAAGGLDRLTAVVHELAAEDLDALPDAEAARRVLVLRRLIDRLDGHWLRELAGVDGRGAAGTDQGIPAESTAAWLRNRTRMGHPDAHQRVRVARALHCGPLGGTARALADGELSYPHAAALTRATQGLPPATTAAAEPVLLEAARRLDHPGRVRWSATWRGRRSGCCRPAGPAAPRPPGPVGRPDLRGHGRRRRAAGPRGR